MSTTIFFHVDKWLDQRDKVNFKFMMSQLRKKTIAITYFPMFQEVK